MTSDDHQDILSDSASLSSLISHKAFLESRIAQLHSSLESLNSDARAPLIDAEGFPRSDLDIVAIKTLRSQLNICFNDHKALMKRIEQSLVHHFQEDSATSPITHGIAIEPIALVKSVLPDSVADAAGLQPNDKIIQFGPLNDTTLISFMTDFRHLLQHRENEKIFVTVRRAQATNQLEQTLQLTLTLPPKGQSLG